MIKTARIQFPGAHGDPIAARLELPEATPLAYALFAHCFTCTKDYKAVVRISRRLAASGVAVCRFDFTGLGESGAAILAAATRIPEARAVVTLAAPSDTEHLSERLFQAASFPKSFVSVDGADHLLAKNSEDWQFVATLIESWARRYLTELQERSEKPDLEGPGQVLVRGGAQGYDTQIVVGRHELRADEPVALGGTDPGPNPYSLLLAALGACKVITMRMYADRKGWPLRGSAIELRHSRIHAKDCEDCVAAEGRVDRIDVALGLGGDLSDEQAQRLLEISERCPVHRTLTNEVSIKTTIA